MAKTYEELLAGATQIKNNELPESNTHSLVGGQLVDMVEKQKEDSERIDNVSKSHKGYFQTLEQLKAKYPSPKDGETAWVGEPYPGNVYDVVSGSWHDTGIPANEGGGSGTSNYNDLENKPSIGNVSLKGNKTLDELGIASKQEVEGKQDAISQVNVTVDDAEGTPSASASVDGSTLNIDLKNIKGKPGPANTITIGTVTASDNTDEAKATIRGEAPNQVLDLTLPRGRQGNSGVIGDTSAIIVVNNLDGGESEVGSIKVLAAEQGKVLNEKFNKTAEIQESSDSSDLDLSDEEGNVILRLQDGHVKTKKFDSKNATEIQEYSGSSDLDLSDEEGNVILRLQDGHVKTKNFDSSKIQAGSIDGGQWNGKTWYAYGTSLTNISAEGKYAKYVQQFSGMTLINKGISGGAIVNKTNVKSAIMNVTDGKTQADLITLEIGANDMSAILGDIYDMSDTTFCGALNQCIRYLQKNTNAQIVIMSSTYSRYALGDPINTYDGSEKWGEDQHTKLDQCIAMQKVCMLNSVYFIDIYGSSGLGNSRMSDKYIKDNIHHTELGGYNIAKFVWSKLKNIPLWYNKID